MGTTFSLLKCLRTHYEPFSGQKRTTLDCRILHLQSQDFFGVIPPDPHWNAPGPGAWTQTPIIAWVASVPTDSILKKSQWAVGLCPRKKSKHYKNMFRNSCMVCTLPFLLIFLYRILSLLVGLCSLRVVRLIIVLTEINQWDRLPRSFSMQTPRMASAQKQCIIRWL